MADLATSLHNAIDSVLVRFPAGGAATPLAAVALGFAVAEADHEVSEAGGNNRGPRVDRYLKNTDPPINIAAPWCAAWVQYVTDKAAESLRVLNPLDAVRREAYVLDYHSWAEGTGRIIPATQARPGDLVVFDFRGIRWDHIGFVLTAPVGQTFTTVEGNTGDRSQRDGDGVFTRTRVIGQYPTAFIRWAA